MEVLSIPVLCCKQVVDWCCQLPIRKQRNNCKEGLDILDMSQILRVETAIGRMILSQVLELDSLSVVVSDSKDVTLQNSNLLGHCHVVEAYCRHYETTGLGFYHKLAVFQAHGHFKEALKTAFMEALTKK